MERMLRKRKNNSEYEIDRELTGKFAIEKNVEYQEKIKQLEEENKKLKEYQQRSQSADGEQIERLLGEKIKLEKENKKLEKENFVMKERLKFGYKGVTREEIDKAEKEKRKLENKILSLGTRIYQNIDGEKRKEYQEYCKRHRL